MWRVFFGLVLICGFVATVSADPAPSARPAISGSYDLDRTRTPASVLFHAPTIPELTTIARPTLCWESPGQLPTFLWIETDPAGKSAFRIASAVPVRHGRDQPYWALLQPGPALAGERPADDRDFDRAMLAILPNVDRRPDEADGGGAGDYARIMAVDPGGASLYELEIEVGPVGSGNYVTDRRIFVLRTADHAWKLIGEGPEECAGHAGTDSGRLTTQYTANFKGGDKNQVVVAVRTTDAQDVCGEDADPVTDPGLTVCRDGVIDITRPEGIRWLAPPYMAADSDDTFTKIARRYVRWNFVPGVNNPAAVDSVLKSLAVDNPRLDGNHLQPGTKIVLPDPKRIIAYRSITTTTQP